MAFPSLRTRPVAVQVPELMPPPPWVEVDVPRRRHTVLRKVLLITAAALAALALAGFIFDRTQASRILRGVKVAGIDVGGIGQKHARARLQRHLDRRAADTVVLTAGGESTEATLEDLGLDADIQAATRRAVGHGRSLNFFVRLYHSVLGKPIRANISLRHSFDREKVSALLDSIGARVDRPVKNSDIDVSTGQVRITPSQTGRALQADTAAKDILGRAQEWGMKPAGQPLALPVSIEKPTVTEQSFGAIILVRVGEQRLYHYHGASLVKTYVTSTGTPGYPTPKGRFKVVNKRVNPSWTNPAPNGWGAGMPTYIPGGPSSPLGTRALDLSASGIRIHGTRATGLLGSPASHGCIRLSMPDVEELYELIPVGTPVFVIT